MKKIIYIIVFLSIFFALGHIGNADIEYMTKIGSIYYITKAQSIFLAISFLGVILGYPIYLALVNKGDSLKGSISLAFGPAVIIGILFLLYYLASKVVSFILNCILG